MLRIVRPRANKWLSTSVGKKKLEYLPPVRRETPRASRTPPPIPPCPSGPAPDALPNRKPWVIGAIVWLGAAWYWRDTIKGWLGYSLETESSVITSSTDESKHEEESQVVRTPPSQRSAPTVVPNVEPVDWLAVKKAIIDLMDDEDWDDGSYGPIFVRLAWHAAGTYDKKSGLGGSEGGTMRFAPESDWGANAGLGLARSRLESVKRKFPGVSYADLWSFAGTCALEEMGGPDLSAWKPGRKDVVAANEVATLMDGLLPDADGRGEKNAATHLRNIFGRMGFNDRELVALSGAHVLGRCHADRSGYVGPWTRAPTTFSNEYFKLLLMLPWTVKPGHIPQQYEDPTKELMMLPTDLALIEDAQLKSHVEAFAKDEKLFFQEFAKAWLKLQELGVKKFEKKSWWFRF